MKKIVIILITNILTLISIIITVDTWGFFNQIKNIDGKGVGLNIFQGLWEVSDKIPLRDAYVYLLLLIVFNIMLWVVSLKLINISIKILK